jgi:hypothetical protein
VLALAFALGACADEGSSGNGDPVISFAADIQPLLMEHCGSCHLTESDGEGSLNMGVTAELAYTALVDQATTNTECANLKRVDSTSSDPTRSSIYVKITGGTCGDQMPDGDPSGYLSAAQVELVRQWIVQGAKNN